MARNMEARHAEEMASLEQELLEVFQCGAAALSLSGATHHVAEGDQRRSDLMGSDGDAGRGIRLQYRDD